MLEDESRKFDSTKLVKGGFIFGEGFTKDYKFLEKSYHKNPFREDICVPIMHLLGIHMWHPMRITNYKNNQIVVYPEEELNKKNPRSESEVYGDKDVYNIASFMIVPYNVDDSTWKSLPIYEDNSLLYLEHGSSMEPEDLRMVSCIMHSQVLLHFQRWLKSSDSFLMEDEHGEFRKKDFVKPKNQDNFSYALLKGIEELEKRYDVY